MVSQQRHNLAAVLGPRRLSLQAHDRVEHHHVLMPTVDQVASLHERRVWPSNPLECRGVDQACTCKGHKKLATVAVNVADRHDAT